MNKRLSRLIALLLTAVMLMSTLPVSSFAEGEIPADVPTIPVETPTEEPAEQPTEEPAEQPTEEPAEQPTEEPAEQPAEEPAEQPAEEPAEQPAEEPAEQPTEKPAEQPTEQPTEEPAQEPAEQPAEEPAEVPAGQPTVEPIVVPDEYPTMEPAEEEYADSEDNTVSAPVSQFSGFVTLDDFGVSLDVPAETDGFTTRSYLNPQTIRPTSSLYGHQWISNRSGYQYPFTATFTLTANYMPQNSVYIAIKNYDCDEIGTSDSCEYDEVYINGNLVGVLTGNNNTSNTTLLKVDRSFLRAGTNEIIIYVGNKIKRTGYEGDVAGKIYRDDPYIDWWLRVDDIQLVCDGGSQEGQPDIFNVNLTNAVVSGSNVNCYVTTEIRDSQSRTFQLEYALYDWSTPSSPTYGQIIDDYFTSIAGSVSASGASREATLTIPTNGASGTYTAVVYLKVYENSKYTILAYDEESFEYTTGVAPAFHIQNLKAEPDNLNANASSVKLKLSADVNLSANVKNLVFYISDSLQCVGKVDSNGHVTGEITLTSNGFYTVELRYTVDGVAYSKKTTVEVNNITAFTGWKLENGKWYYLIKGVKVLNTWMQDSKGWVYLGSDGAMVVNSWLKDSVGWVYVGANGYVMTNCWLKDTVGWVYVNANGYIMTNAWVQDANGWLYVGSDGYIMTNAWVQDSTGWCYLDAQGYIMSNTWLPHNGKWYYLDASGHMRSNCWMQDAAGWVYLGSDGAMVTNCWMQDAVGWVYLGANGYMVRNCWMPDASGWCYLGSDGYMLRNVWLLDNGNWYYLNNSGHLVADAWLYIGSDGAMVPVD